MNEKRFMLDDAGELIDKETAQFIEYGEKVCDLLNDLNDDNCQLKRKALDMEMDRDYYRTKSASLEEGYIQLQRDNEKLKSENKGLQGKASSWKITASEQIMEQCKLMKENEQLKQRNEFLKKQLDRVCSENEIIGDKLKKIGRTL